MMDRRGLAQMVAAGCLRVAASPFALACLAAAWAQGRCGALPWALRLGRWDLEWTVRANAAEWAGGLRRARKARRLGRMWAPALRLALAGRGSGKAAGALRARRAWTLAMAADWGARKLGMGMAYALVASEVALMALGMLCEWAALGRVSDGEWDHSMRAPVGLADLCAGLAREPGLFDVQEGAWAWRVNAFALAGGIREGPRSHQQPEADAPAACGVDSFVLWSDTRLSRGASETLGLGGWLVSGQRNPIAAWSTPMDIIERTMEANGFGFDDDARRWMEQRVAERESGALARSLDGVVGLGRDRDHAPRRQGRL